MKKTFKLSTTVATSIALGYQKVDAAKEFFRSAATDPDCPGVVSTELSNLNAQLTITQERLDRRIPVQNKQLFNDQIKNNDSLRLEEINRLYFLLNPKQQETLETIAAGMARGEEVHFVDEKNAY